MDGEGAAGAVRRRGGAAAWWRQAGCCGARAVALDDRRGGGLLSSLVVPWTWARVEDDTGYADTVLREQIGGALLERGAGRRGPFWYLDKIPRSYWPWLLPFALGGIGCSRDACRDASAQLWLGYGAIALAVTMAARCRAGRATCSRFPMLAATTGRRQLGLLARWLRILPALAAVRAGRACSRIWSTRARERGDRTACAAR